MSLIGVIVLLIILGVGLRLVNIYVPMQPAIKSILNTVVILIILVIIGVWLLQAFGVIGSIGGFHGILIR